MVTPTQTVHARIQVLSVLSLLFSLVPLTSANPTDDSLPLKPLQHVKFVHFGYEFEGQHASQNPPHGEVWMDLEKKLFRLTGFRDDTQFGDSQISVIVDGQQKRVYTVRAKGVC